MGVLCMYRVGAASLLGEGAEVDLELAPMVASPRDAAGSEFLAWARDSSRCKVKLHGTGITGEKETRWLGLKAGSKQVLQLIEAPNPHGGGGGGGGGNVPLLMFRWKQEGPHGECRLLDVSKVVEGAATTELQVTLTLTLPLTAVAELQAIK